MRLGGSKLAAGTPQTQRTSGVALFAFTRSRSAFVSQAVYAARPKRIEPVASPRGRPWEITREPFGQLVTALAPRRVARRWYEAALPKGAPAETVRHFLAPALEAFEGGACFCLASAFQATFGRSAPSLGRVTQPTAVVWGGADRSHRRTARESMREYVPHAAWYEWETAGHFPELEAPERFAALVARFQITAAE